MQKLYSFIYPYKDFVKIEELYIHGTDYIINPYEEEIQILKGGNLHTCSYYNSFSLEKWTKYTELSSLILTLKAKGKFVLNINIKYLTAGDYLDKTVFNQIYNFEEFKEIEIDVSSALNHPGLLYFEMIALNDTCVFSSSSYRTNQSFRLPNLGIVICTFKREPYIHNFIKNFNFSPLKENILVFISDNGKTLEKQNNERVFVFPNRNVGGAGGFTRGMIEIQAYNNKEREKKIDYVLLLDDDIVIDFNIFERLLSFLALRYPRYANYFLAGSMCSLDYPFLQYERYSSWRGNSFVQSCANYDLRDINTVVTNEREDHLNNCSSGWWFSCFSVKMISKNNYPFPCFFRGDDIEFTIRNGSNLITLNGINVWHEPFYKKYSIISENYYLFRNTLVINSLYLNEIKCKNYIKYLFKRFVVSIITYDYKSAELLIMAWKDYCKGTAFFVETDSEELNKSLMKLNYQLEPLEEKIEEYRFDDINYEIYNKSDKSKISSFIRHITLNGFLIPKVFYKNFSFSNMGFAARYINFYCTKTVFNFDPFTRKGYFTQVNKFRAIKLLLKFFKQALYFSMNFNRIKGDYQQNFWKLQTEEFWQNYLDI